MLFADLGRHQSVGPTYFFLKVTKSDCSDLASCDSGHDVVSVQGYVNC